MISFQSHDRSLQNLCHFDGSETRFSCIPSHRTRRFKMTPHILLTSFGVSSAIWTMTRCMFHQYYLLTPARTTKISLGSSESLPRISTRLVLSSTGNCRLIEPPGS